MQDQEEALNEYEGMRLIYRCPYCKTIPSLRIAPNNNVVKIKCKCNGEEEWDINFDDFFSNMVVKKEIRKFKYCEGSHKKKELAKFFCHECPASFCLKCLLIHNQDKKDHSTYLVEEVNQGKICNVCFKESKDLKTYCMDCKIQICPNCRENHKKENIDHTLLNIESLSKERSYIRFKDHTKIFAKRVEEDRKTAENIIQNLETRIKEIKEIYRQKIEEDNQILKYLEILNESVMSYGIDEGEEKKDILDRNNNKPEINPTILRNIEGQNIDYLSYVRREKFFEEFISKAEELKNILPLLKDELLRIKDINPFIKNENCIIDTNIQFFRKDTELQVLEKIINFTGFYAPNSKLILAYEFNTSLYKSSLGEDGKYSSFEMIYDFQKQIEDLVPNLTNSNQVFIIYFASELMTIFDYMTNQEITSIRSDNSIRGLLPLSFGFIMINCLLLDDLDTGYFLYDQDFKEEKELFSERKKESFTLYPIQGTKFLLLISFENHSIQIYKYMNSNFEEVGNFNYGKFFGKLCVLSAGRIAFIHSDYIDFFKLSDNHFEFLAKVKLDLPKSRILDVCPLLDGSFIIAYNNLFEGLMKIHKDYKKSKVSYSNPNVIYKIMPVCSTNKFITLDKEKNLVVWEY